MITRELHSIEQIYNRETLNIFSDASTRRGPNLTTAAGYTAVAMCKDTVIDKITRIHSDTTNNAEEARGLRAAIRLAIKYAANYERVNIFSDSAYAVNVLKNFNGYRYNNETQLIYSDYNKKKELCNQGLFIECAQLMIKALHINPNTNVYFNKGHVSVNNIKNLQNACRKFKTINKMAKMPDYQLIRYISTYNNYVDEESRQTLRRTNVYKNQYIDPIEFFALRKITI